MSNLQTTQRTADAITVVWDPAGSINCGHVLYYIVTIRNLAIPYDTNSFNLTLPRAEFHDLVNNISYAISVRAVNRVGVGMETTINVTTLAIAIAAPETSQGIYTIIQPKENKDNTYQANHNVLVMVFNKILKNFSFCRIVLRDIKNCFVILC